MTIVNSKICLQLSTEMRFNKKQPAPHRNGAMPRLDAPLIRLELGESEKQKAFPRGKLSQSDGRGKPKNKISLNEGGVSAYVLTEGVKA